MKPFLILQLRPIDLASDNEYDAFLKYGGLNTRDAQRVRMEKNGLPQINLDNYSGIILGGGPSNVSDTKDQKYPYQLKFESGLRNLLDEVFENDFPFLGTCYGVGALVDHQGGIISKENYSEKIGVVNVRLTEIGKSDPLLIGLPDEFIAYGGHKEACQALPDNSVLLATSTNCPVQMIRFKENIYATQFHTELDMEGICLRIEVYKDYGYFSPGEAEKLIEITEKYHVEFPNIILKRFVEKYRNMR